MADQIPPVWDLAAIEAMDTSLHKKRVQGILEAALAAGLKRRLEGTMSNAAWTELESVIAEVEQAGALNVALVGKLAGSAVDPTAVAAAMKRLQTVRDSMLASA